MAFMTVWFVSLFLECSLVELFQTETTDKVFWMKLSEHGSDTPTLKTEECLMTSMSIYLIIMHVDVHPTSYKG